MTTTTLAPARPTPLDPRSTGRLLSVPNPDLRSHHGRHVPLSNLRLADTGSLLTEVEASGLRGRGGGWFPTGHKLRAVVESSRTGGIPVVVANGMEGEPESYKDAVLLQQNPHLVLDGAVLAARLIDADQVHICVHENSRTLAALQQAVIEREAERLDPVPITITPGPNRYVASEENALSRWVSGTEARPRFGKKPFVSGVGNRPTLVQNVETLAQLALIIRYGADWFRQLGTPAAPGTTLITVSGAVIGSGVIEVPVGTTIDEIIHRSGGWSQPVSAYLTGGYGGAWVGATQLHSAMWDPDSLRSLGGTVGASVLVALPERACGLRETARALSWLAGESSGQCGPCRFGLSSISSDFVQLCQRPANHQSAELLVDRLIDRLSVVEGRGACRLPDGAVRLARTALHTFAAELKEHRNGLCTATSSQPILAVPAGRAHPVARPGRSLT